MYVTMVSCCVIMSPWCHVSYVTMITWYVTIISCCVIMSAWCHISLWACDLSSYVTIISILSLYVTMISWCVTMVSYCHHDPCSVICNHDAMLRHCLSPWFHVVSLCHHDLMLCNHVIMMSYVSIYHHDVMCHMSQWPFVHNTYWVCVFFSH